MSLNDRMTVMFIGSYVPRKCGIATFTHNLALALSTEIHGKELAKSGAVSVAAMTDRAGEYAYGPEVRIEIDQFRKEDYRNAAEILNTSRATVICLQHEYGLFAGDAGSHLFELVDRLRKPLVSTLHTVLSEPSATHREVLRRLCRRSSRVVVMADRAKSLLKSVYEAEPEKVCMIHHGVHEVEFADPEPFKERFGLAARPVILTFGLLSPNKGIETMLEAVARVVDEHPDIAYVVLGETHPAVRRESGEQYRLSLERLALKLGIHRNVLFHNRYVSEEDIREYLLAADIYATPYRGKEQITSGTLAYALASGRAVISTPYWYAQELLAGGRGRLANFDSADEFAVAIRELLRDEAAREKMRRAAYDFGKAMIWPQVARRYSEVFEQACATFRAQAVELVPAQRTRMRMSLPEVRLDHLFTLTDDTGILQHSVYMTPNRRHGYCTDDNARALIVTCMAWTLFQDEKVLPLLSTYLSFLHFAHIPEKSKFHNFMSYDRRWLDDDGSDDCQGRALWALGYLVCHAPSDSMARLATELFRSTIRCAESLGGPRSWAFVMLGLHYYLSVERADAAARDTLGGLAHRLCGRFAEYGTDDWPWCEDVVTYDNGRLPQALIIAGVELERPELVERGIDVLKWLIRVQTADEGHLTVIGNDGWMQKNGARARFAQQALEPAALIGACKAAYTASSDRKWLGEMRRCFDWYVGRNDVGRPMVDFRSRGCFDALEPGAINPNEGAESLLSWLLSLLIMHEMQSGDEIEVG